MWSKHEGQAAVHSVEDLVSLVNRVDVCYLFKKGEHPRVCDMVKESDSTVRRGLVLVWSEEAHLKKKLFLSVDEKGSLLLLSSKKVRELPEDWSQKGLSRDEKTLLEVLDHPMSTPELREAAHLPKQRFENALIGLRAKMRLALVGVRKESKTKHINVFDKIGKWDSTA